MAASPAPPSARVLWALLAAVALLWFVNLDARRLLHPDEGRYAEIAREMAATGDWVTPRLNELKYFEKPPFQYWATAAAYRAFGVHEWTARLWPALAGFLAVVAIGCAGYALGGAALGAYAGLALAATFMHAAIAQIVTLDAGLSSFLALGFAGLVIAQRPESGAGERRAWMWVAWAALAGATLSKGLIGVVLPGGALVVYTALTRDFALWRRLHLASGLALYFALTVPWFVAVARANDEFLRFFFVHEHFERFLTTGHDRAGPWYYFVPWFAVGILPWLTVLAYGAWPAWRDGTPNALGFSWQRFALVWAAFVFLFFSASGSKLPSYILPMFPPLALVIGWLLVRLDARTLFRLMLPLVVAGTALTLGLVFAYDRYAPEFATARMPAADPHRLRRVGEGERRDSPRPAGSWRSSPCGAPRASRGCGCGASRYWRSRAWRAVQIGVAGFDAFSPMRSTSAILRAAQQAAPFAAGAPFYQVEMHDQTVPFYLGRATRGVAFRQELSLGIDAEPSKQIPTVAAWVDEWRGLAQGYAILGPELQARLAAEGVPMRELARDPRRVVVSRQ